MSAYESLSHQHQRFVDEYIVDFNGTKAYLRAGYGCTEEAARRLASKLLTKDDIQSAIAERNKDAQARVELSKDRVLKEVMRLAFVDIRKLYKEDGVLKLPSELDDDTAAALASLEVFEEYDGRGDDRELIGHTRKVKLYDKKGGLELLMRHLGMLNDKLLHDVDPKSALASLIRDVSGTAVRPVQVPPKDGA